MLIKSKTEGGACVRMQRLVPFDSCSSLSEMQSKYALSSTCQACLTTANGTIRCPGTRWTRFRSPEKPGYPVASPSPNPIIWRVPVRGGYTAGGTPSHDASARNKPNTRTSCQYLRHKRRDPRLHHSIGQSRDTVTSQIQKQVHFAIQKHINRSKIH